MDARDRHNGQRDERTDGRTDEETRRVSSSVRLLDGVLHFVWRGRIIRAKLLVLCLMAEKENLKSHLRSHSSSNRERISSDAPHSSNSASEYFSVQVRCDVYSGAVFHHRPCLFRKNAAHKKTTPTN